MKLADALSGLLAAIAGIAVVLHAFTFPPMPGQPVGPSLFPIAIGTGLILAGAALMLSAARRPLSAVRRPPSAVRRPLSEFVEFDEWARRPRMVANFFLVVTDLTFYAIAVDALGFLITSAVFLAVLFLAFGVRRARIVPFAVAATLVIHYGFYTLLRVPLPWGVLEGVAW
jgi:putative tricarboxylic transport membrane protein